MSIVKLHKVWFELRLSFVQNDGRPGLGVDLCQPKTYLDCLIDHFPFFVSQATHFLFQSALVNGADLLRKNDTVFRKSATIECDVSRQLSLTKPRGDGRDYGGRSVLVADIVLEDNHRSQAALLTPS